VDNEISDGVVSARRSSGRGTTEIEGRLTLFGIHSMRSGPTAEQHLLRRHAKFEGCEHASGGERRARI